MPATKHDIDIQEELNASVQFDVGLENTLLKILKSQSKELPTQNRLIQTQASLAKNLNSVLTRRAKESPASNNVSTGTNVDRQILNQSHSFERISDSIE